MAKHVQVLLEIGGAERFLSFFPNFTTITTADWVSDVPWEEGKRLPGNAMKRVKAERASDFETSPPLLSCGGWAVKKG